jgi:hypothetical protein
LFCKEFQNGTKKFQNGTNINVLQQTAIFLSGIGGFVEGGRGPAYRKSAKENL